MSKSIDLIDPRAEREHYVPKAEEIRIGLRAILASTAFHGSKRSQQFLEYVCEKSLNGGGASLKERTLAVEVFGRPPESDLGEDTIVRVSAREVRKRLAQYYSSADGAACELRIDLPSGSYAPEFHFRETLTNQVRQPSPKIAAARPKPRWMLLGGVTAAAAVAFAAIQTTTGDPNARAFKQFWEPVLSAPGPLLIAVAHPIVYHVSGRAQRLSQENQPPDDSPLQRAIQVSPEKLDGSDLVPVFNQYVGFGDLVVATEISSMLAGRAKPVRARLASNLAFADLRKAPALLIGAVTNRWTVEMQQSWRYRFDHKPGTRIVIIDSSAGSQGRQWSIPPKADGTAFDDYLMVCRIHSNYTGSLILVAAGLKQFGTEAAGRLLADSDQLGTILRKLPRGWESRNLQLVLHARVIGNTPAQPEVVATHVW